MEERKKMNFIRHASPPASKKYILKILFYVAFLGVLLYLIFSRKNEQKAVEIEGVKIELTK